MLFRGAVQAQRNETDHEPIMRQESFFAHLFGAMESGCYGVIDGATGRSTLFIPRLPPEYVIWMGTIAPPESFTARYGVDETKYVDELLAFLLEYSPPTTGNGAVAADGGGGVPTIHTVYGVNSDTGDSGPPLPDFEGFAEKLAPFATSAKLRRLAVENRVIKSDEEVALLKHVNDIASDAHVSCFFRLRSLSALLGLAGFGWFACHVQVVQVVVLFGRLSSRCRFFEWPLQQ